MTHSHYDDDYPERGRPRSKVGWTDHHETVLRALYWHTRTARLATDQSIYDCIVRFRGSVISPSGARTRRQELERDFGLVVTGTARAKTEAGRPCATFRLTDKGHEKAAAIFAADRQTQLFNERPAA